jgi:hypothetical protein
MNKAHAIITAHGQTLDGWEGSDACLEISLLEYGMIWRKGEESTHFIFTVPGWDGNENRVVTDWAEYANKTNVKKEWSWAFRDEEKTGSLMSCLGAEEGEWLEMPLERQVDGLVSYWGALEIFGESYHPTVTEFPEEEESEE